MKLLSVSISLGLTALSLHAQCPVNALFLAVQDQIRGYSLRSNGPTQPCQFIRGANTQLSTARWVVFSKNQYFHVLQFLTNGTFDIFAPDAKDDATPTRVVSVFENDLSAIAVDSKINDFVASIRPGQSWIAVLPNGSTNPGPNPIVLHDPNTGVTTSLAVDDQDNLLAAGYDQQGNLHIDTLGTSISLQNPPVIRSITGANTGLLNTTNTGVSNNVSIALDPVTQELYVYNSDINSNRFQISVFGARANGNVAPIRVIGGPNTSLGGPSFIGSNKIAVSSDGRLFVAESKLTFLGFAPGANGNVAPAQVFHDTTNGLDDFTYTTTWGIGVRNCACR